MNSNQKKMVLETSISLGLKLLGSKGSRSLQEHFNTSLVANPTYCMRLNYMARLTSEDLASWLYSKGKIELFNRLQKYTEDINQDPEHANANLANGLFTIAGNTKDNAARILSAAAMSLFYDDEGVIGDTQAMARVNLDDLFNDDHLAVINLCAEASFRFSVILFFALWKTNYDGVYEALCKLLPKEESLTNAEKAALQTEKRVTTRDLSIWLKVATNFYKDLGFSSSNEYDSIAFILMLLLEYREKAASVITKRHPEFLTMEDTIKNTNTYLLNSSSFNDKWYPELKKNLEALGDLNQTNQALHDDIYFSIFMAAHGSFLFQGNADFWQQHIEKLFTIDEEVLGLGHGAMIVVLLWSTNYHDFQTHFQQSILGLNNSNAPTNVSAVPESSSDSSSQASFPDVNSLRIEVNTPVESNHSDTNTSAPVQARRRRRSERYDNETQPNIDRVSDAAQIPEKVPAQPTRQVEQSNRRVIAPPETVTTNNNPTSAPISISHTVSGQNSPVQEANSNDFKQLLKSVPDYFKDKKSLGVIIGTTILFSAIFGFSFVKLFPGVVLGIAAVYFLKKKNIFLKSSVSNNNPLMRTNNSVNTQRDINLCTSQPTKSADNSNEKAEVVVIPFKPESMTWESNDSIGRNKLMNQSNSAIQRYGCLAGNSFFNALIHKLSSADVEYIHNQERALSVICSAVAACVNKSYDVSYRNGGISTVYKGWLLERLYRAEEGSETLYFDYCLGEDGILYMMTSYGQTIQCIKCVTYSPIFLSDSHLNVFTSAISGVIGTLDSIPIGALDGSNAIRIEWEDDSYTFNFPIEIVPNENGTNLSYAFLGGVYDRLRMLLDEDAKDKLRNSYKNVYDVLFQ